MFSGERRGWKRRGTESKGVTAVADLLNAALFSLSQGDPADTLFYLRRAKGIAFGPALARFDPIIALVEKDR